MSWQNSRVLARAMGPVIAAAALFCAAPAAAQDDEPPIGNATQIVRTVTGEIQAQLRYLLSQDPVFSDEVIETQPESASRIVFRDLSELSVGPRARVTLDKFVFDPDPSLSRVILSAFDGVFRFKSGRLANNAYAIETPNAVIGVRGTTFATAFGPNGETAVVLEAGRAVFVQPGGACPIRNTERLLDRRDMAIVIDGCNISFPQEPPEWATAQIASLNLLLFQMQQLIDETKLFNDDDTADAIRAEPATFEVQDTAAPPPAPAPPPPAPPAHPPSGGGMMGPGD